MHSRKFSIFTFLFSVAASTAIFVLLSGVPQKKVAQEATEVTVFARTIQKEEGLVLGETAESATFEMAGSLAYGSTATFFGSIAGGDGVNRLATFLDFPEDVARDSAGNFYVADTWNHRVRKVSSTGTVTTLAGSSHGYYENAGTKAKFAYPKGVAVDSQKNVYVADSGNGRIRKITPTGITSTLVSGLSNPEGVAVFGSTLYIAETGGNKIRKINTNGSGFATLSTGVNKPKKLAVSSDGNTVFVANEGTHQILQVRTASGSTSVLSGSGTSGTVNGSRTATRFVNVRGLTLIGLYLYVTENNGLSDNIRKVHAINGDSSTFASDTTGNTLSYVSGITNDGSNIFVANSGSGRIEKFSISNAASHSTHIGTTQYQERHTTRATALVGRPTAIHYSPDKEYMYMITNNQFKRIDLSTLTLEHVIGDVADNYREGTTGDESEINNARFSAPFDFALNSAGTVIYLSDRYNNRIRKIDLTRNPVQSYYITGAGKINASASHNNGYKEGSACNTKATGISGCAYFSRPSGVALSKDGKYLYVADTGNHRIRRVDLATGTTALVAGSTQGYANGKGSLAKFNNPHGLEIDSSGQFLYVADRDNHRIRKIRLSDNVVTTLAGSGANGHRDAKGELAVFSLPLSLAFDTENHLYVSDVGAMKIRAIDLNTSLVQTVTGSGTRGLEEGSRTSAQFNNPEGLIADLSKGLLYVADTWNDVIRQVGIADEIPFLDPAPVPSEIGPSSIRQQGGSAYVDLIGSGFRYGMETYVGQHKVTTYPKSSSTATLVLPMGSMPQGRYDVRVINLDQQTRVKEQAFFVSDSNGNTPLTRYQTPSLGIDASLPDLVPNFFTGTTKDFHDATNTVNIRVPGNALPYNAFIRVIRSSDIGLPDNPGWIPASATREFQAIKTTREILSVIDAPVSTTFSYDPSTLSVEEGSLNLFYYKPDIGRWVGVRTEVNPKLKTVTGIHRGSSVRLKLFGKPKGDSSVDNLKLDPLPVNYFDAKGGTFQNQNGAVKVQFPAGSVQQDAFVRVFESFDSDIGPNTGWRRVSAVRHFQALTTNRANIGQLRYPVTITAKYNREHLGSVSESSLTIFYWDFNRNRWLGLTTTIDTKTQTVTARYLTPNVRIAIFGK